MNNAMTLGIAARTPVTRGRVLLIDSRLGKEAANLTALLQRHGWQPLSVDQPAIALAAAAAETWAVGIFYVGDWPVRELKIWLHDLHDANPGLFWIALTKADRELDSRLRDTLVSHFYDFHRLPVDASRLLVTLGRVAGFARLLEPMRPPDDPDHGIIHRSVEMKRALADLRRCAVAKAPILITGETGTGKELAASYVREMSSRAAGPYVAINCGAIPSMLIQSELFGYEKGAFTGADKRKPGRIVTADGGTLFLDEVGELPLELQPNLLRVLQEGLLEPVGGVDSVRVNVRIIAATNVDLEAAVAGHRFRQDLFFRLSVLTVNLPPLRSRPDDIEPLAWHFLRLYSPEACHPIHGFSQDALGALQRHHWPGNVRELSNRVRRAVVLCQSRLIEPRDLDLEKRKLSSVRQTLQEVRDLAEKDAVHNGLRHTGQCVSAAARLLGVSRGTLYKLIAKHQLQA